MAEFAGIDFADLLERLTRHAYVLFGCFPDPSFEPVLRGYGDSPADLAKEALKKFLDPEDKRVQWKAAWGVPTQTKLLGFLKTVIEHDFVDMKRSKRYKTRADLPPIETDDENGISLDELAAYLDTPEAIAIRRQTYDRLLAYVEDEPDLHELLEVQLNPDGYCAYTNQQVATLLCTSVEEIENRRKRLERRLLKFLNQHASGAAEG